MRIIFVRHGHPDYDKDCLTELGHLHGAAVAERLKDEPVEKIFSSTHGRAMETAEHIDEKFGLGIIGLEFMRETKWGGMDGEPAFLDGHPWFISDYMVEQGMDLLQTSWQEKEEYRNNRLVQTTAYLVEQMDVWLADLGYIREGDYYRVGDVKYHTIVVVSHGGASTAALGHLFNLPLPFLFSAVCPDYTAVTVVSFSEKKGALVAPKFELANDARHIADIEEKKRTTVYA